MSRIPKHVKNLPTTPQEVAATGLRTGIKLAAHYDCETIEQAETRLALFLHCNIHQLRYYARHTGLPAHFINEALDYFRMRSIPIYRYQLKPTRAVLYSYGFDADE